MVKILLADDHCIVRAGLKATISNMPGMTVVAEAKNGHEVLDVVRTQDIDIVILDLSMPGRSGLDTLYHIQQEYPEVRVLILTLHSEEQYGRRLLRSGANGYLSKDSGSEQLEIALRTVVQGKKYIPSKLADILVKEVVTPSSVPLHAALSDREYEILLLIGQVHSPKEIGFLLSLSPRTVGTYRKRILGKLKINTIAELIGYTVEHRLLDQPLLVR